MFAAFNRGLPLVAALVLAFTGAAHGAAIGPSGAHREAVDEHSYPWSSLGKLTNETGGSCSGAVIARDKVLTAAHCVYNFRTRHYIAPSALHFLVGYRTGSYSAHVRFVRYEVGPGFDPQRYNQTSESDWVVLTASEPLPADIEPLRLRAELTPSGTKAVMAGYGQDRAYALTADRDCALGDEIIGGRLLLHTCHGNFGSSGAPILVKGGDGEMQIAGVQIASMGSAGDRADGRGAGCGDPAAGNAAPGRAGAGLCDAGADFAGRLLRRAEQGYAGHAGDDPRSPGLAAADHRGAGGTAGA